MKDELKMGLRSLVYRRKQYLSLFLVCLFGVGVSLFCLYSVNGMLTALEDKARIYYGGDLQFIGGRGMDQPVSNVEMLKEFFPEDSVIAERYDFDADYAAFYFEGTGVRQRVIKGVNFEKEKKLFASFNYIEGSAEDIYGTNGVLLSEPIAKMLEVHAGDEITFMLRNGAWQINTVPMIVKGIFRDSSLFGMYTSYMDREVLSNAYGYPATYCNRICVMLPEGSPSKQQIQEYQDKLSKKLNMFRLVEDKQEYYNNCIYAHNFEGDQPYALIKLSANLQEIQIIIDAMKAIVAFVIAMLLIIIVTGVSSTFRVIAMKRINEIGIYKAIGMKRFKIYGMLLTETLLLIIAGCIAGYLFSCVLTGIIGLIDFSFIPAFDIFLINGKMKGIISFVYFLGISMVVIVTTLAAVMFAVKKSVSVTPCQALAVTE
jgi:ABC-type lipoprotein release transport system permease subunit